MLDGYKNLQNMFGLKALLKTPEFPAVNLAIGGDDAMGSVPLTIFAQQGKAFTKADIPAINTMPYEVLAAKFSGDTVSLADMPTDDFGGVLGGMVYG